MTSDQTGGHGSWLLEILNIVLPLHILVDELVEAVEALLLGTVQVVPPVTHKVLLVENSSIRAEEPGGGSIRLAHVEHLAVCLSVCINARVVLLCTVKASVRHRAVDRVVCPSLSWDGVHYHLTRGTKHVLQSYAHTLRCEVREPIGKTFHWLAGHLAT